MEPAVDEQALLAGADFFLSILPPGEAGRARRSRGLHRTRPQAGLCRLQRGQPADRNPHRRHRGPILSMAGSSAGRRRTRLPFTLRVRPRGRPRYCAIGASIGAVIDGPVGAASALKMSYAGIAKGTTAIAAMLLGAARFGCGDALIAELGESQPEMLARFRHCRGCTTRPIAGRGWRNSDFLEQAIARHLRRGRPPLRLSGDRIRRQAPQPRQRGEGARPGIGSRETVISSATAPRPDPIPANGGEGVDPARSSLATW